MAGDLKLSEFSGVVQRAVFLVETVKSLQPIYKISLCDSEPTLCYVLSLGVPKGWCPTAAAEAAWLLFRVGRKDSVHLLLNFLLIVCVAFRA